MNYTNSEKVQRILRNLIPKSNLSNMVSKHSAVLMSGGKPVSYGYNHQRTCNCKKVLLSTHAEMHALNMYFNKNREYGLKNYINDSHYSILGRQSKGFLEKQIKVACPQ